VADPSANMKNVPSDGCATAGKRQRPNAVELAQMATENVSWRRGADDDNVRPEISM
jgi:hypothetical protein